MRALNLAEPRIVAVHPTSRGFGFAVLEGPGRLIDWGTRTAPPDRDGPTLDGVRSLIALYRPAAMIVEDPAGPTCRRCPRVKALIGSLKDLAGRSRVMAIPVTRTEVRRLFARAQAATKHEIARTIAEHFPELEPRLPPRRKPWMSQDERMSIFDAVAFGLTFFYLQDEPQED